jgi:hypothetical protein
MSDVSLPTPEHIARKLARLRWRLGYPRVAFSLSLQLGIGVSTLIGSVYRVVTKLAFPPGQVVESSLLYFYSGSATLVVCTGMEHGCTRS